MRVTSMALVVGTLQAVITADRSQHARALRDAEADDKSFKKRTSGDKAKIDGDEKPFTDSTKRAIGAAGLMREKIGSFLGDIKGQLLALGAVGGIVGGIKSVVMAASDLAESANAINVIFGDAADSVFEFTSTASKTIGQSDTEARQAMATFGAYGKQAGLATQQNAAFSQSMVKLASDLASFKNTSVQEAIEAIGAAFRGESDPIEQYNVLINESVLQQRALKMGVIESTSQALTPQQRVLVAYQEILAQTKDAQGDFGRTSGELANQLRTLRAQIIDKAAALGQNLLPAAKSVVSFFNGAVGPAFDAVAAVLRTVLGVVGDLAQAWSGLPGPVQAAIAAFVAWKLVQDRVTDGVSGLGDRLAQPFRTFADEVKLHTALAAASGEENIGKLAASMSVLESRFPVLGQMAARYRDVSAATSEWLQGQNALTAGSNVFTGTLRGMVPAVDGFVSRVSGAVAAVGTGLRGAMSSLVGFLGGPWGVAILAGTLILGQWTAQSQKAAARQKELAEAGKDVAQAIRDQNGELNKNTRAAAAKAAEDKGLLKLAKDNGIAMSLVTDAVEGQKGAYQELQSIIKKKIDADMQELEQLVKSDGLRSDRAKKIGVERDQLLQLQDALARIVGGRNMDADAQKRVAEATGLSAEEVNKLAAAAGNAEAAVSPMEKAISDMSDEAITATDKISGLQSALDELNGEKLSVEEATQAINDTLRDMGAAFDEAEKQTKKAGVALIDASGAIDTTTEAGSSLQNKLTDLASDYNGLFAATVEAAQAQGKTLPEALVAAAEATGPMRQRFIDIAHAAGINDDQIALLVQHYGLVPNQVNTSITQPGMLEGIINAIGLKGKIEAIPNGWQVVLTSTAPEQIELMKQLGLKVQTLPDGRVVVSADTAQAWSEINKITTPKTVLLNLQLAGYHGQSLASAMKQYGFARGGYMPALPEHRAGGGGVLSHLPYVVGEEGREIIWPTRDGYVSTAAQTRDLLRQMAQVDRRMVPATAMPATGGVSPVHGGDGASMPAGQSYVDRSITVHAVPSVPTIQQLQDLQHEQEILYGA